MIHSFEYCLEHKGKIGVVEEVHDFLVKASGLLGAHVGEGATFESGEHGRIMSFDHDLVEILVLSRLPVKPKTKVALTGSPLSVSCGSGLLGHTINTLGYVMTKRRYKSTLPEKKPIDVKPAGISVRDKISRFLTTGITSIDLLVPIGMGQRELIIGDRKTGKTHLLVQILLTQAKLGNICIYCAIGKRKTEIKTIENFLKKQKVDSRCLIVASDSYSSPAEIFLCPFTAMTIAEYFRDLGRDVLLILDDLSTHAKYYREISLLSRHFPGRESYPGDIFHIHSKLLERAGCFKNKKGQATITCLPVAESAGSDITGYIQTNLMSMTDGHIFLDQEIFFAGRRPAVNIFLSVTRVGRQTQDELLRDTGKKMLSYLKKFDDAQRFLRFGPELGEEIRKVLKTGEALLNLFCNPSFEPVMPSLQAVLVSLCFLDLWDGKNVEAVARLYLGNEKVKNYLEKTVQGIKKFEDLNEKVERERKKILEGLGI